MKKKPTPTAEELLRAIRAHCLECSGNWRAVRSCNVTSCKLWPYRKNEPKTEEINIKGQMSIFDFVERERRC